MFRINILRRLSKIVLDKSIFYASSRFKGQFQFRFQSKNKSSVAAQGLVPGGVHQKSTTFNFGQLSAVGFGFGFGFACGFGFLQNASNNDSVIESEVIIEDKYKAAKEEFYEKRAFLEQEEKKLAPFFRQLSVEISAGLGVLGITYTNPQYDFKEGVRPFVIQKLGDGWSWSDETQEAVKFIGMLDAKIFEKRENYEEMVQLNQKVHHLEKEFAVASDQTEFELKNSEAMEQMRKFNELADKVKMNNEEIVEMSNEAIALLVVAIETEMKGNKLTWKNAALIGMCISLIIHCYRYGF